MKKFPEHFYVLEQRIYEFLKVRNRGYRLWDWALNVPLLDERLTHLVDASKPLQTALMTPDHGLRSVLDLGCGLCMYWPFFYEWGFTDFVGVDLFSMRGLGAQEYEKTAEALAGTFCPGASKMIVEGDIRDIDSWMSPELDFDLIFTKNTNYQKLGSTGIPRDLFDDIVSKHLADGGIAIYAG